MTSLASWSSADVRVADVVSALESVRRGERLPATRTAVLTLVMVASSRAEADRAVEGLFSLGGRHPARTLVLLPRPAAGLEAEVRLLGGEAEGHGVWFEHIELGVGEPVASHLDSLVEPFTLPDLPVVAWYVDAVPPAGDSLLRAADVVLVDARDLGEVGCFSALAAVSRSVPVIDLSWVRLRPWRELLAGLFEGRAMRPYLREVRSVSVRGKPGPRALLAGWVADRLGLGSSAVSVAEDDHASITLHAPGAEFSVRRPGNERVVVASASVDGGPSLSSTLPLPPPGPAWGLAEALSRLRHDHLYERALRAALALPEVVGSAS